MVLQTIKQRGDNMSHNDTISIKYNMDFSAQLKLLRSIHKLSQTKLAEQLGVSQSTIAMLENKERKPSIVMLAKIADFFDVDLDTLAGRNLENVENYNDVFKLKSPNITEDVVTFPVIGEIAAGYDEIAVEDWSGDTVDIPTSYLKGRKKEDFFVLSVHGDSMYPMYLNGDKVLILKQNTLDHSGDVGAILYEGECATLKKVEYVQGEDWLRLVPINPEYQPKLIEGPDLELCRVIGVPRLLVREID